jgi:twitching motility two-component system response regulator PilH
MSCRILIVDDEPDVALYLATILRTGGHEPQTAADVEEGLRLVQEAPPDLICLDIMMPKESGVSMYKQLKQNEETAAIPVIVISGVETEGKFDFSSYVPNEELPPPECFMEKPIKVDEFLETIERLLRGK